MFRLTRLARPASGESGRLLASIASRLPEKGLSGSHLFALLEDEFPLFTPSSVGALSLLEAFQMHPAFFSITTHPSGDWSVRPAAQPCAATTTGSSSAPADTPPPEEMYHRLCEYFHVHSAAGCHGGGFIPLEVALRDIGCEEAVGLADLLIANSEKHQLETDLSLHIKLTRQPRAGIVFVDGSELPATAVNDMCDALRLIKDRSTVFIARHAHHVPLSASDNVAPEAVPLYLTIEKKARQLTHRCPLVLQDVIYMCSARQFHTYAQHVATMNLFPDADVYVCCPSRIQLVQPKTLIPFFDEQETDAADAVAASARTHSAGP